MRDKNELSDVLFSFKASPQVGVTVGSGQMSPMSYPNSYSQSQQVGRTKDIIVDLYNIRLVQEGV